MLSAILDRKEQTMAERIHTWLGGLMFGLVFGLVIGFMIVGDKLPTNPNYVETLKKQDRLR